MNQLKLSVVIFSLLILVVSCSDQDEKSTDADIKKDVLVVEEDIANIHADIEASEFNDKIGSGLGLLIDVRTPEEFSAGHIPGSINIDFNREDFSEVIDTLNRSTPVLVYCQAGGRSGKAMNLMVEKDFHEVYNLIGGFGSWPY